MHKKLPQLFLVWLIVFVVFLAWAFPEHRPVNYKLPKFTVANADALYFKNIRQYYYLKTEDEKSGFTILRYKQFFTDSLQTPILTFALINNWRQSECYVVAQWHGKMVFDEPLEIEWSSAADKGTLVLKEFNNESQFVFAGEVYSHLIQSHTLTFEQNPLFTTQQTKSTIKMLKDYFKLVGKVY